MLSVLRLSAATKPRQARKPAIAKTQQSLGAVRAACTVMRTSSFGSCGEGRPLSRQIASSQMLLEHLGCERSPGCRREKLIGAEKAAFLVHVRSQPIPQGGEVACAQCWQNVGLCAASRLEQLRRCHGAQGVGREIAPGTARPMNVLETAKAVVWNRKP